MKRLCVVLLVILLGPIEVSVPQVTGIERRTPDRNENSKREKFREMIALRLVEYLELNEDQSAKLFPLLRVSHIARSKIIKERRELYKKIAKGVEDKSVSIKDLRKQIKELEENKNAEKKAHQEYLKKSKKFLDERQYIKLLLFEDKFREDFLRRIRAMRDRERKK